MDENDILNDSFFYEEDELFEDNDDFSDEIKTIIDYSSLITYQNKVVLARLVTIDGNDEIYWQLINKKDFDPMLMGTYFEGDIDELLSYDEIKHLNLDL